MLAAAPARATNDRNTTTEVSSKVVPAVDIMLHTTEFRGGNKFREFTEKLGTLYATRDTVVTKTTDRPTRHFDKIVNEALANNAGALAAGETVTAATRGRGRPVAQIRAADPIATTSAPRTPLAPLRPTANPFTELVAPAVPKGLNPLATLGIVTAAKAIAQTLTETAEARTERQRREQDEAAKLKIAQADLGRARNEIDGKLQGIKTGAKGELNAETSRIESMAQSTDAGTIRTAIEIARTIDTRIDATDNKKELIEGRTEATAAQPIAHPFELLVEKYQNEGAPGRFKTQIFEALTAAYPTIEALDTHDVLTRSEFGTALIMAVQQDLAAITTEERGIPSFAAPVAESFNLSEAPLASEPLRTEDRATDLEPMPGEVADYLETGSPISETRLLENDELFDTGHPFENILSDANLESFSFPASLRRHVRTPEIAEALELAA